MTYMDSRWRTKARELADTLLAKGDIRDPRWHAAVAAIPRHHLVPTAYQQTDRGTWTKISTSTPEGVDLAYSPTTLITALAERNGHQEAVSSSTKPDLMARMLELLDVQDDHRVLEIGTGTGYNAALLSHRLGDRHVYSIDIDPELIETARHRLADLGYRPTLVAGDGEQGLLAHSPYDRIIATCAVAEIPWIWIEQLRDSGLILADLKLGIGAGNLVLLRRHRDGAEGKFTNRWAAFMEMRHSGNSSEVCGDDSHQPAEDIERQYPRNGIGSFPWQERVPWFLAQLDLPKGVRFGYVLDPDTQQPTAGLITTPDGSQARIPVDDSPTLPVTETGPTPLWEPIRNAYRTWHSLGKPGWPRLGLTVDQHAQTLWIDHPESNHRWTISPRNTDQRRATQH